jgi:hypothetical protein
MIDNPYRSTSRELALAPSRVTIYWRQVATAFAISLIGGCVLAVLWAVLGFCVYFVVGPTADAFYRGPIAAALGWCVGLIPFVAGLFYLCHAIEEARGLNCILVTLLAVLTSVPFLLIDDQPFDWTILGYYVLQFVLAAGFAGFWNRTKS